jgi:uncharacterized damage-inducible protein DinB
MKALLTKQIQFEHWANSELLKSLRKANPLHERALSLFSHIVSPGQMWLNRVKGEPITTTLWEERTLDQCEVLLKQNTEQWLAYLDQASDAELKRVFEFTFFLDGSTKQISVADSIMHVVHHSSYHRGQIVSLLKGIIEPLPLVTYIGFVIENPENQNSSSI